MEGIILTYVRGMPQRKGRRLLWRFQLRSRVGSGTLSAGEGQAGRRQVNGVSTQDESVTTIVLCFGGRDKGSARSRCTTQQQGPEGPSPLWRGARMTGEAIGQDMTSEPSWSSREGRTLRGLAEVGQKRPLRGMPGHRYPTVLVRFWLLSSGKPPRRKSSTRHPCGAALASHKRPRWPVSSWALLPTHTTTTTRSVGVQHNLKARTQGVG
ncbi:hypothetical protein GGTG_01970 [Gaeumannomyces tritici R3-111a-1]|uniref:Uncharacterized protein n=1 Tax=Gaeumannomyces tritici (strain R3-111a-1) TaxID=644352 RepID=J3NL29_GAET3|nr:hypothetical protein GGTG_01970 [Gaeumannomyces tritici R3-111a-1]EJT81996.1 hypothetical protein GGTG_01970 [Gaeumannomyces tritici R3-111a-1]